MANEKVLNSNIFRKPIFLSLALILSILLSACSSEEYDAKKLEFQKAAKEQFDVVQNAWNETGELDSIVCDPEDCSSIVYFNFNKLPINKEDGNLETIIRSNAAIFSNLRLKIMGTSHVVLIARMQGKDVIVCNASKGMVDECTSAL